MSHTSVDGEDDGGEEGSEDGNPSIFDDDPRPVSLPPEPDDTSSGALPAICKFGKYELLGRHAGGGPSVRGPGGARRQWRKCRKAASVTHQRSLTLPPTVSSAAAWRTPARCSIEYNSIDACPQERIYRSRLGQCGAVGS